MATPRSAGVFSLPPPAAECQASATLCHCSRASGSTSVAARSSKRCARSLNLAAFSMPGKLPTHNRRSALEQRCAKKVIGAVSTFMSSQIGKHFEEYARYCSELARAAATLESRQRLLKMAGQYIHAAELMRRTTSESLESNLPRPPRVISANLDPRMPSRSARAPQSIDHPAPSRTAARSASHSPASTSSLCALSVRTEHTDR
jgi:hypothetical protein